MPLSFCLHATLLSLLCPHVLLPASFSAAAIAARAPVDALDAELLLHASFAAAELALPCTSPNTLQDVNTVVTAGKPALCVVTGAPGSGKRAVLAHAAAAAAAGSLSAVVAFRQCCASTQTDTLAALLRAVCMQVQKGTEWEKSICVITTIIMLLVYLFQHVLYWWLGLGRERGRGGCVK